LDFLGNPEKQGRRLEILSFACSNGAEVYTMASWLLSNVPGLDFRITASDLHQEMVERCEAADYSEGEALQSEYITTDFVDSTFDRQGERYVVKPNVRERVTFTQANLLDDQGLKERFGPADIVTAQNVLFHLKPPEAERAFNNVVGFLKERSVLMVEGMDLDLRSRCTTEHGLRPLGWDLKNIYSETRVHTPPDWWNYYWGTEPFTGWRSDKERRYATIFLKG
jgi:chemotaxis methyl-accepting protein methylase